MFKKVVDCLFARIANIFRWKILYFYKITKTSLSIINKECLRSYPCIKLTLTENMRPFDSFQYVKATREQDDHFVWDIWNHTSTPFRVYVGPFNVSSQRWGHWFWGRQRMVNALKKNPIQRHSANNYTSMSHFNGFHFMPYLGRRPSCSGRTYYHSL